MRGEAPPMTAEALLEKHGSVILAALEVYSERMKEASVLANVEYPVAAPAFGESADKADQAHRDLTAYEEAPQPIDPEMFARTAPAWNCIADPDEGPHYLNSTGGCSWCGMTNEEITDQRHAQTLAHQEGN